MKKVLFGILFSVTFFFGLSIDDAKAYSISSGTYKIVSTLDETKVLTSNEDGNIQINTDENKENQLWNVILQNDGSYIITSKMDSSKSFDAEGGLSSNGTNIRLFNINKTNAQKWTLRQNNDNTYFITSKINNYSVLDVSGGKKDENTNIQIWSNNGTDAQKFKFIEVVEKRKVIDDGTYIINTKLDTSLAISLDKDILEGANVNLDLNKSNYIQAWDFKYLSDGYYEVSPYNDEKLVLSDVNNNIQINNKTDDSTKWKLKDNFDGTYSLISNSNYYMDVSGGIAKAGTNIQLFQGNNTNAQKFIFTKVDFTKIEKGLYNISTFDNKNVFLTLNNKVVFNGTNVELYEKVSDNYQKWYIENIEENIYEIKSAIDANYVFDVSAGSISSGANIQAWQSNSSGAQRWRIIKLEDNSYRFTNVNSGKNIDVSGAVYANGTNIQQFDNNGTNAQKFYLNKTEISESKRIIENGNYILYSALNLNKSLNCDYNLYINDITGSSNEMISIEYIKNDFYALKNGNKGFTNNSGNIVMDNYSGNDKQLWYAEKKGDYYTFISKADGKVLDIVGGNVTNKTKLQAFVSNNTNAQKFYLEAVQNKKIENGYFTISSNGDYLSIDSEIPYNSSNVITKDNSDKWYIKNVDDNLYEIRYALNQNKVLDVRGGNVYDGNGVQLFSSNSSAAQRWHTICLKDGSYKFVSAKSHTLLTIVNNKAKIYSNSKDRKQKFTISSTDSVSYGKTIDEGYYTVNSSLNNKKVLDVSGGNIASGTNVQLWTGNNTVAQIWKFKYLDNGLYSITSALNPKRALTSINGNVQVHKYTGGENQKWYITGLESGYFSIVSANDGLYLDVDCAGTKDGTNIKVYDKTGSPAQKFSLNEYKNTKTYKGIDISKWQGNINWKLLVTENPQFIIMRVGRGLGDLGKDVKFEEYYMNANNYDIPVGVYIYGFATNLNEAKKEADYVIEWLNKKHLDLPVFYDMEYSGLLYLGKDVLTEIAESFCGSIITNNYHCGIYANIYWLNNFLDGKKISSKYPIWLAHWTGANNYDAVLNNIDKFKSPYSLSPYKYWQFSSLGKYPGITENTVDLDFGYDIFD